MRGEGRMCERGIGVEDLKQLTMCVYMCIRVCMCVWNVCIHAHMRA